MKINQNLNVSQIKDKKLFFHFFGSRFFQLEHEISKKAQIRDSKYVAMKQ